MYNIECTTSRVKPNIKYGLWMRMMVQCRFINWNKGTTLLGDIDSGGDGGRTMQIVDTWVYGNLWNFSSVLLLSYSCSRK